MITEELRNKIFARDFYTCRVCGKSINFYGTPQIAHGIGEPKRGLKMIQRLFHEIFPCDTISLKQAEEIRDHPAGLCSTCSLKCNSVYNFGNDPGTVKDYIFMVWLKIRDDKIL